MFDLFILNDDLRQPHNLYRSTLQGIVMLYMEQVNQYIQQNDTSPLVVEGCVVARRLFGSSFGFMDIVLANIQLVQIMVKQEDHHGELVASYGASIKGCMFVFWVWWQPLTIQERE